MCRINFIVLACGVVIATASTIVLGDLTSDGFNCDWKNETGKPTCNYGSSADDFDAGYLTLLTLNKTDDSYLPYEGILCHSNDLITS